MDPTITIDGKVYVFRVKATAVRDWDAPDVMYGLAHEGGDGVSFQMFKELSIKKNKKDFVTKKANVKSNDVLCTGADMLKALKDWSPLGNPVITFTDKPASWYTVAKAAYSAGIFSDSKGFDELEALFEKTKSDSPSTMLKKMKDMSKELALNGPCSSFASSLKQGEMFLTNTGFSIEKLGRDDLVKLVDNFKIRAVLAEEKAVALETEVGSKDLIISNKDLTISSLEDTLKVMQIELQAAQKSQAGFMAAGDMKALEAEVVKKTSNSILTSLRPMIASELEPLKLSLESTTSSLKDIKSACSGIPTLQDSVVQLTSATDGNAKNLMSHIDTSEDATMEVLTTIQNSLISTPRRAVTGTVSTSTVQAQPLPPTPPGHEGTCYYQAVPGVPGLLRCILGCNSTTSAAALAAKPSYTAAFPPNLFQTPPPPILSTTGDTGLDNASMGGVNVDGAAGSSAGGGGRTRGRGFVAGRGRNDPDVSVTNSRYQRFKKNKLAKKEATEASIEEMKQQLAKMQQQLGSK